MSTCFINIRLPKKKEKSLKNKSDFIIFPLYCYGCSSTSSRTKQIKDDSLNLFGISVKKKLFQFKTVFIYLLAKFLVKVNCLSLV